MAVKRKRADEVTGEERGCAACSDEEEAGREGPMVAVDFGEVLTAWGSGVGEALGPGWAADGLHGPRGGRAGCGDVAAPGWLEGGPRRCQVVGQGSAACG